MRALTAVTVAVLLAALTAAAAATIDIGDGNATSGDGPVAACQEPFTFTTEYVLAWDDTTEAYRVSHVRIDDFAFACWGSAVSIVLEDSGGAPLVELGPQVVPGLWSTFEVPPGSQPLATDVADADVAVNGPLYSTCLLYTGTQDALVADVVPTSNFGGLAFLGTGRTAAFGNLTARAFVQFDGASNCFETGQPFPGGTIVHADLTAFVFDAGLTDYSSPGTSRTIEVQRADAAWAQGTLTWNTQPGVTGTAVSTVTGTEMDAHLVWDVTTDVAAFVGGSPNNGWRLVDADESTYGFASFRSTEHATATEWPLLFIAYE